MKGEGGRVKVVFLEFFFWGVALSSNQIPERLFPLDDCLRKLSCWRRLDGNGEHVSLLHVLSSLVLDLLD